MNFAKNLLGKYGWKEGEGLGRDKHGITKPLKANYKFNNAGLGHNPADDMNNHWWENVYNKAATNLNVEKDASDDVQVGLNSEHSVEITTKNYSVKNNQKKSDYDGAFLKSATLTNEGHEVEFEQRGEVSPVILKIVSDDELFRACGGRTAHKGARHGLKLSGKLNRIEQQEQELLNKIRASKEDCSQVFKEYVDCKSRYNTKKLKRLNKKELKKKKSHRPETVTSAPIVSIPSATPVEDEAEEEMVEESKKKVDKELRYIEKKLRKNRISTGKVEKRSKRKHEKKLKKLAKEVRVPDSKDDFMKKLAIEELPISFESVRKLKRKSHSSDLDDVSLHSYRCRDEQSQSDNDGDPIQQNILCQLSDKLNQVKKKKQKVIVENLTEFQIEHLRNANVPFVEIKQSSRSKSKKNEKKFNRLANNLVDKMSIL